ncbi:hypothetical protein ACQYAD_04650 [Neobacillus sp. SM06]|uniref:hypothetical protein n=1 Tax=Neobacillus sp. SM06 TaxID=3422492 RepID=UPI003D2695C3
MEGRKGKGKGKFCSCSFPQVGFAYLNGQIVKDLGTTCSFHGLARLIREVYRVIRISRIPASGMDSFPRTVSPIRGNYLFIRGFFSFIRGKLPFIRGLFPFIRGKPAFIRISRIPASGMDSFPRTVSPIRGIHLFIRGFFSFIRGKLPFIRGLFPFIRGKSRFIRISRVAASGMDSFPRTVSPIRGIYLFIRGFFSFIRGKLPFIRGLFPFIRGKPAFIRISRIPASGMDSFPRTVSPIRGIHLFIRGFFSFIRGKLPFIRGLFPFIRGKSRFIRISRVAASGMEPFR